jgi:hypothetical protein
MQLQRLYCHRVPIHCNTWTHDKIRKTMMVITIFTKEMGKGKQVAENEICIPEMNLDQIPRRGSALYSRRVWLQWVCRPYVCMALGPATSHELCLYSDVWYRPVPRRTTSNFITQTTRQNIKKLQDSNCDGLGAPDARRVRQGMCRPKLRKEPNARVIYVAV